MTRCISRAGNGWWWVPLVAPFIGGVTGATIYKAFVELHHPDLKSTKTQSTEDPECVPLEKYKNGNTDISVWNLLKLRTKKWVRDQLRKVQFPTRPTGMFSGIIRDMDACRKAYGVNFSGQLSQPRVYYYQNKLLNNLRIPCPSLIFNKCFAHTFTDLWASIEEIKLLKSG